MIDVKKNERIKVSLEKLNSFIFTNEITDMEIKVFHLGKLIITGSFDFCFYHQVEIIFEEVSFLSIPDGWNCKKLWGDFKKDKNASDHKSAGLTQQIEAPINFVMNDANHRRTICNNFGICYENDDILFTIIDDDDHNYYILARDIIVLFDGINYRKNEGYLYEFPLNLKSENIGFNRIVKKSLFQGTDKNMS